MSIYKYFAFESKLLCVTTSSLNRLFLTDPLITTQSIKISYPETETEIDSSKLICCLGYEYIVS